METQNQQIGKYQVSEIKVSYLPKFKIQDRPKICSSLEAYNIFMNNWDFNRIQFIEQFKILLLNRCNKVLGIFEVSTGGVAGTVVDPKIIFSVALKANASNIILAHNHPSGNLKASEEDIKITNKLIQAAKFLDIRIFDHIILSHHGYYSFGDEGLI